MNLILEVTPSQAAKLRDRRHVFGHDGGTIGRDDDNTWVPPDQLQHAYSVLGLTFIRDVATLRSGEIWNEAILAKIPTADIFQLCWSHQAKTSRFVEQEWRQAVALRRPHFIRPVYWELPMPAPPADSADLHFARLHWLEEVV